MRKTGRRGSAREFNSAAWTGRSAYLGLPRGPLEHVFRKWEAGLRTGVCQFGAASVFRLSIFSIRLVDVYVVEAKAKTVLHVYLGESWVRGGVTHGFTKKLVMRTPVFLDWGWWAKAYLQWGGR